MLLCVCVGEREEGGECGEGDADGTDAGGGTRVEGGGGAGVTRGGWMYEKILVTHATYSSAT